jgi:hypothetical protein
MKLHYDLNRDPVKLGRYYTDHVAAMTREGLHSKSDIAAELAYRDLKIDVLLKVYQAAVPRLRGACCRGRWRTLARAAQTRSLR